MPALCPVALDTRRLTSEIRTMYARVADNPAGDYHFHRGPDYAASVLGYLVPDTDRALAEIRRMLAPGGRLQFADILLARELSEDERTDIDLWTG